jgi:hypothetical protein
MFSKLHHSQQRNPRLSATRQILISSILSGTFLISGCEQLQLSNLPVLLQNQSFKNVSLDWQIERTQPGGYEISGKTDLPEQTQLTVAALRYLYPAVPSVTAKPTYMILDYQSATVKQGKWQSQLNVWRTATNGSMQENWQLDQQELAMQFQPDANVVFLVTLAPIEQLTNLQRQLASRGERLASGMICSTETGERYAQSHQILAIAVPKGEAANPVKAENFGWGRRYLMPFEPQNPTQLERPTERQTNAPIRAEEFLR